MSKAEIVQRLIEGGYITAEEAVILLSEHKHHYHPSDNIKNPYDPPFEITCNTKVKQMLLHPQSPIPLPDAVHILRMHNRWRRGSEEIEMIDPQLLGECIDRVIEYFDQIMLLDKTTKTL